MLPAQLEINALDILKFIFGLLFLVPIRLPLSLLTIVISWAIARLAIVGLSSEDLERIPLQGWRKLVTRGVSKFLGTILFMCLGIR